VAIAAVIGGLITPLTSGPLLLGMMFLWGGLAFSIYSIAVAQMVDQLHPDEILSGSSGLLLANGFGAAFGPVIAGGLMSFFGPKALPVFFAVTLAFLALYSYFRARRVFDLVTEPHGHFTPMLRTSHTVLELMPDTPEGEVAEADILDQGQQPLDEEEVAEPRTGTHS
jgi:MFS family permease